MYQVVIVDDEVTISEGIANLFPWKEIGFEESQDHERETSVVEVV